jgi:hypothetical protein
MRLSFAYPCVVVSFVALSAVAASTVAAQATPEASDESAKLAQCRQQLDECVRLAEAPESISSCSQQQARCIADVMQVSVPEGTSVGTLTQCAANAADCSLYALTTEQWSSCARSLASCIDGVVETALTCPERWTQCVQGDPVLFPICALELLGCTDP